MTALFTIIHVIICLILIVAVLLQSGKAADLAGAFGGGGSQSAFGPRGAQTLLSKVTTTCAVLFMITSMGLWILSSRQGGSVLSGEEAPPVKDQPAAAATTEPGTKAGEEAAPETKPVEKKAPEKKEGVTGQETDPPEKKSTPPVKKK